MSSISINKLKYAAFAILALIIIDIGILCCLAIKGRADTQAYSIAGRYSGNQFENIDFEESSQKPKNSLLNIAYPLEAQEKPSPKDRISEKDINVYGDRVIVKIKEPKLVTYSYSEGMEPTVPRNTIAIGITPDVADLQVGDIVSYKNTEKINLGRIAKIGFDETGWYAILKEDSSSVFATTKIRQEQLDSVVITLVYDKIKDTYILQDKIVMFIDSPEWARFTDTNSMDPVLDIGTHAIEQKVASTDSIKVNDIVSYEIPETKDIIIHRIIKTGSDSQGWFAIEQGDNISFPDSGKIRQEQLKRVVAALVY